MNNQFEHFDNNQEMRFTSNSFEEQNFTEVSPNEEEQKVPTAFGAVSLSFGISAAVSAVVFFGFVMANYFLSGEYRDSILVIPMITIIIIPLAFILNVFVVSMIFGIIQNKINMRRGVKNSKTKTIICAVLDASTIVFLILILLFSII